MVKYNEMAMQTLSDLPTNMPVARVEFDYDYMSRRVGKTVYEWGSNSWQEVSSATFLYDAWNLISEQTSVETNFFTFGLDLSGTLQGAGGIGGLVSAVLGTNVVCYTCDGNGNVSELINCAEGAILSHYEYSPFGETIVATGGLAKDNPFRFSAKYTDDETLYYGFRFYSPTLGRWLSRDPIEELGGLNLYLFAGNQSVNLIDPYGLIGLGDLLRIGGSLQHVASNPLIRGSVIASMLLSAADCLLNLAQLAQDPPDCVKTDLDQGVWIGECRDNTKDAVSSCSQLVGGIIGSIGGGAIGNLIGQIISRAAAELFNALASDGLIDSIGGCDSPPAVDPCCGVGGSP
jgi:RHS repeat-associated protein